MLLGKLGVSKHDKLKNLDYASAGHTAFAGTGVANTFTAKQTITVVPTGTSFGDAPLVINPASANANERLLDVGKGGVQKFHVDEDGDGTFGGKLTVSGTGITVLNGAITVGNLASPGKQYVYIRGDDDSDDDPGCLVLYDHAGTAYYLWVDNTGDLRIHTAAPGDEDADGTIVGTQS